MLRELTPQKLRRFSFWCAEGLHSLIIAARWPAQLKTSRRNGGNVPFQQLTVPPPTNSRGKRSIQP